MPWILYTWTCTCILDLMVSMGCSRILPVIPAMELLITEITAGDNVIDVEEGDDGMFPLGGVDTVMRSVGGEEEKDLQGGGNEIVFFLLLCRRNSWWLSVLESLTHRLNMWNNSNR